MEVIIEKAIPIETPIGLFENHRDAILLENIEWEHSSKVIFFCNITKNHIKNTENKTLMQEFSFKIIFFDIISLFHSEYDTYEAIKKGFPKPGINESVFEIIENSNYLKDLPIREDYNKEKLNHYYLQTYDDVFNIIACSYKIEML